MEEISIFYVKLEQKEIEELYNDELMALCGGCCVGWEITGEKLDVDFCHMCNQPAILNYVR